MVSLTRRPPLRDPLFDSEEHNCTAKYIGFKPMKAAYADGGSPTFERDDQQRKVPIGLDKSWESRRVEGIELMVSSIEQQKERQKKTGTCKCCPHGNHQYCTNNNNNGGSCCSGHHHHHHHHHHNNNNHGNVDEGFVLPKEKTRSLTGAKKNKMSIPASAPQQKSLVFDGSTHVEGSSVGRRRKQTTRAGAAAHDSCLTPDSFKVRELEQQVLDLIHQLAQEKHQSRQDKICLSKLQQQVARTKSEKPVKEMLMKELEQEKRRREALEQKFRERNVECCCQKEMVVLKKENTRLNEVVQDLLPYKSKVERLKQSNASSAALLEAELHRLRSKLESLDQDNSLTNMELRKLESIIKNCQGCRAQLVGQIRLDGTPRLETSSDSDKTKVLLERLKNLEAEKSSLVLENEAQFRHYEKCLEDVTNQILDALLAQKTLKEECSHLKERVAQLETENLSLKKSQPDANFRAPFISSTDDRSSASVEFRPQNVFFRPDPTFPNVKAGCGPTPVETKDDDEEEEQEEEEEDGCRSSLSLNEILDSAAGSTNGSTDGDDGNESGGGRKGPLSTNPGGRSRNDSTSRRRDVFVGASLSEPFADCSCGEGVSVRPDVAFSAESGMEANGNPASESESSSCDGRTATRSSGTKNSGRGKIFRSGDSGWKKFLPVGCTSPQEERDEGYLSNKTSEGSSDVSNPFQSRSDLRRFGPAT